MIPKNVIRQLRKAQGLTQRQLAQLAKVSPRTLQAMEQGKPTKPPTRRRVLTALGLEYTADHGWCFGHLDAHRLVLVITDNALNRLTSGHPDASPEVFLSMVLHSIKSGSLYLQLQEYSDVPA